MTRALADTVSDLQTNSSVDGSYSFPLLFERLAEVNREGFQWTECEIADAINLVNKNIQKLDSYLSLMVRIFHNPFIMWTEFILTPSNRLTVFSMAN